MGIKLPDNAEISMAGLPFHGLWKSGIITLPNDETITCPAPANGACVLLRVPGQPAVSRTTEQLAADAAAGMEWRNYGLISGGRIGSQSIDAGSGYANVMLIDAAKIRWRVRIAKNSSVTGQFTLALQRFGHIDGTTSGWTSTLAFTVDTALWSAVSGPQPLLTIAQNTTGREFVIGAVNDDGASAMAKISLTGTVDTGATGFGLTISSEMIEWSARENFTQTNTVSISGECTSTTTYTYAQSNAETGLPTGVTFEWIRVWIDGTLTEDNGEPPEVAGHYWTLTAAEDSDTSTKVKTSGTTYYALKHVWAAYLEDVLKLVSFEYSQSTSRTNACVFIDHLTYGYYWDWDAGPETTNESLDSLIGDDVVYSHELPELSGSASSLNPPGDRGVPFDAENLDGYSDSAVSYSSTGIAQNIISYADELYVDGGVDMWRSWYLWLIPGQAVFGNPVVVLVKRTHPSGNDFTYANISVHAPSLESVSTTDNLTSENVTWQPVTDQLTIDSEKICWF